MAKERDDRPPISTTLTTAGKLFDHVMLDAQKVRERGDEPLLGQSGSDTQTVRGIGEGDIVGVRRELVDESHGVGPMHDGGTPGVERIEVCTKRGEAPWRNLDKVDLFRAAR